MNSYTTNLNPPIVSSRIINCASIKSNLKHNLIWLFNLKDITDDEKDYFMQFLDFQESRRAISFRFEHDRKCFIICRALVKIILSDYCNLSPRSISFKYNSYQRPYLLDFSKIDFNVAHTKEWGILTVYIGSGRIGIDIESIRSLDDIDSLMKEFTSHLEQNWVLETETLKRFYLLWSAKESLLKAIGMGFAIQSIPYFETINHQSEDVIMFQTHFSKTLSYSWNNYSVALSILDE